MARPLRAKTAILLLLATGLVSLLQYESNFLRENNWNTQISNWRQLDELQVADLSVLGHRLFLSQDQELQPQNKTFTILIWKFGPQLERRHIHRFNLGTFDPFEDCSVANCRLTYKDSDVTTADAVLFHLHQTRGPNTLPQGPRAPEQRWVFLTDESPYHTFMYKNSRNTLRNYNGIFNWSMTYRMDADVPVPYGRTLPLTVQEKQKTRAELPKNHAAGKSELVAILSSVCLGSNGRWKFINELKKHIPVDVYGGCGTLKCPGHFGRDCPLLNKYKFYLAFENSNCRDYVTEKVWWNAYEKGAVPIVMGASRGDCARLLPPHSYIHVEDFSSPRELAHFLYRLSDSDEEYNLYFNWKKDFKIVNEHGYFQSPVFHYCRLCEALNYNSKAPKVYNQLEKYWSIKKDCYTNVENKMAPSR